jgi:predicted RNase H-like nuclease (RuvC/YqgF family)
VEDAEAGCSDSPRCLLARRTSTRSNEFGEANLAAENAELKQTIDEQKEEIDELKQENARLKRRSERTP